MLENSKRRRNLYSVFNDQDNESDDKKLPNLNSITVNRNLSSNTEVSKKCIDDSIGEGTFLRFNQTLENYLEVSDGIDVGNLTKYDKIQFKDTTVNDIPNSGREVLESWVMKSNDKKKNHKIQNFIISTKSSSPSGNVRAVSSPPVGIAFMYI